MAKRKQAPTYTADGLVAIKRRLAEHKDYLVRQIVSQLEQPEVDFDGACFVRDKSQHLTTTVMVLGQVDDTIKLVEMSGRPQVMPFLDQCGLDD